MRCFIGLLLCVCVALRLTEGLVCLKCTNKADGVACYNSGTSSKSCIDGLGFQCGVNVGYKKSKGSGGKWQRSDIARGCNSPKVNGCVKSGQRCDCYRFCGDDNCNDWSTPDSPSSPDWGSNNNC